MVGSFSLWMVGHMTLREGILVAVVAVVGLAIGALLGLVVRRRKSPRIDRAKRDFHTQRELLEAKFLQLAAATGKPRGLAWEECDFEDSVAYVRDRKTGQLSALVAVTIRFSAVEGGGMEDVEAVGNLRAATGVFQWRDNRWMTEGRVLFNMNPIQALEYFGGNLEMIDEEIARPVS